MPDIGEIVGGIFDWIFAKIVDFIISPFIDAVENTFMSTDSINQLQFVDLLYENMRAAGKSIGLFIRMFERLILSAMLLIFSPLAFACGVSQPTRGFMTAATCFSLMIRLRR